ncbi:hypothetical protein DNTS_005999 [Danionella cerebrum]|uniref:Uncharacterized protein n=1 Tax=Danionella cerebrum TaxID=2873325 RepID=A0A553QCF3_9TELE|nr:hypothetical protein DNTS_005999 [Danionella translucida]
MSNVDSSWNTWLLLKTVRVFFFLPEPDSEMSFPERPSKSCGASSSSSSSPPPPGFRVTVSSGSSGENQIGIPLSKLKAIRSVRMSPCNHGNPPYVRGARRGIGVQKKTKSRHYWLRFHFAFDRASGSVEALAQRALFGSIREQIKIEIVVERIASAGDLVESDAAPSIGRMARCIMTTPWFGLEPVFFGQSSKSPLKEMQMRSNTVLFSDDDDDDDDDAAAQFSFLTELISSDSEHGETRRDAEHALLNCCSSRETEGERESQQSGARAACSEALEENTHSCLLHNLTNITDPEEKLEKRVRDGAGFPADPIQAVAEEEGKPADYEHAHDHGQNKHELLSSRSASGSSSPGLRSPGGDEAQCPFSRLESSRLKPFSNCGVPDAPSGSLLFSDIFRVLVLAT